MTDITIAIQRKRASKRTWIWPAPPTGNTEQQYRVFFEGEEIGSWGCPECDAARWLLANGKAQRSDTLRTRRRNPDDGSEVASMKGGVGWFADRVVIEDDNGPIRWGKYRPFPTLPSPTGSALEGSDDAE
jgi:hypothetical protein